MNNLFFNILTFDWPEKPVVFYFKEGKQDDGTTIHKSIFPKNIANFLPNANSLDFISTTFDYEKEGYSPIEIDFKVENKDFIKRFYNEKIKLYFKKKNPQILKINFVKDNQIWIPNQKDSTVQFKTFDKFTLSVNIQEVSDFPELQISYDGQGKILKRNIFEVTNDVSINSIGSVFYNKKIEKYKSLADKNVDFEKVYPVLNNTLKSDLKFKSTLPKRENKYTSYFSKINQFYVDFLNTSFFKQFIPINTIGFLDVSPLKINRTDINCNKLIFGNNSENNVPNDGLKANGPFKKSTFSKVQFFYIYHEDDLSKTKIIDTYLKTGLGWFKGVEKYINLPISTVHGGSIAFKDKQNPLSEIKSQLSKKEFDSDIKYIAIYLTPFSKNDESPENRELYYKIKEQLLIREITSQVIDANKIWEGNENYAYNLPNIAVALLAKLDGIPWKLNIPSKNELIVGIGAFKDTTNDIQYIGSAFSFDNTGGFKNFEYFTKSETRELAGSIINAIREYASINKEIERLIIHFYKAMSEKEIKPIQEALDRLKLDIPIFIVTINKTVSQDIVAFDEENKELMPLSGTYVNIGNKKYLLYNNSYHKADFDVSKEGYPFPIKLQIDCTDKTRLVNTKEIKELIEQVYQFSRMYWKSIKQQNLPVTIKYPEMVAQIAPHFEGNEIPSFGKDNLWFL
jgi:hypothetical protein